MKKIELLSPVGDFECLKAAVQNGADSVYFGASIFNARISANNFDIDTSLKEAITYAKLRGVNTHLTLNTLIKDFEFKDAVLLAKKAYEYGIDAIIVQDLGLARFLIKNFPDMPIHASTQMTIHNLEGAIEAQNLGYKRVVLSRELSLEEIKNICANTDVEIETFIHGALCICYSGQCLLSSMVGGRSGNRGKCAQPCRLPYKLEEKDLNDNNEKEIDKGYLLSTKDLCGLEYIPSLIDAGVMCFKIEGRMKSPEYVATVTRIYRKYIDLALSNAEYKIDDKDVNDLKQVFNRGGFSSGHFSKDANKELVYPLKQNHMGILVGNVESYKENKAHIQLKLTEPLSIGDSIEFEHENTRYTISELMIKNTNIQTGRIGQFVEIGRMKGNIKKGDKIYKVSSKELSNQAFNSYQKENKKILLNASISIKLNEPICLNVETINNNNEIIDIFKDISVSLKSDTTPVEAKNMPITKDKIIEQLSKTTDTIFTFSNINVNLDDNLFIPSIKSLNELRRNALDKVLSIAQDRISRKQINIDIDSINQDINNNDNNNDINNISNREISLLLNVLKLNYDYTNIKDIDKIYIPLKYFSDKKYESILKDITDKFSTYIYLPTIIKSSYTKMLNTIIEKASDNYKISGFVFSNLGNIRFLKDIKNKYPDCDIVGNYTLNVYNKNSTEEYKDLGLNRLTISPELDLQTIEDLSKNTVLPQELIVYGRIPLMNSNYCLLGKTNKCYSNCEMKCSNDKVYYLKDRMGLNFPILPDNIQTVTTIFNSKITAINGSLFNVNSYRIDILDEDINQINNIIESVKNDTRFEGKEFTNGNLNREI